MKPDAGKLKGRGTIINPQNRFEKISIDNQFFDDLPEEEQLHKPKPETIFLKDNSKSAIAKNDSEDVSFDYSINPYRGCEHGCVYCYARQTHEYLGFSSGLDFETKIMVKEDIASLLESTFKKKSYKPDVIILSGNTDCYQPIERKLELTRSVLKVCLKYRNPVAMITKNKLIERDIDILSEMAKLNLGKVTISLTTLDKNLQRIMEPRTSTPEKRIETIKLLSDNSIPVGINLAPIIPAINDEEIPQILKTAAENGATSADYIMLRLPFSTKEVFLNWLQEYFPERKEKVISKIKEMRNGKLYQSDFGVRHKGMGKTADMIHSFFEINCKKYGLNKVKTQLDCSLFSSDGQIELFH